VVLAGVVDRVFRDLDHQVLGRDDGLARQARLRLQAPGLVEQVFLEFLCSFRESKPSRTITWQVVQAQDFSQACSMSMSLASSASQTEVPGAASMTAPSGHSTAWGRMTIWGTEIPWR
jgi:hypothetical protein